MCQIYRDGINLYQADEHLIDGQYSCDLKLLFRSELMSQQSATLFYLFACGDQQNDEADIYPHASTDASRGDMLQYPSASE